MILLRRLSQIFFFVLFIILFIFTADKTGTNELTSGVKFFFWLDPLFAIGTFLASHQIFTGSILSILTIILTIVFGRAFCGWVCPFGALNQFLGYIGEKFYKKNKKNQYLPIQKLKYFILFFFLAAAIFGLNLIGILDPFSFFTRSFAIVVLPIFQFVITIIFNILFNLNFDFLTNVAGPVFDYMQDNIFYLNATHFSWSTLFALIFFTIIFLNFYKPRFWCRVICPLGAFLGLLSRISFFKLTLLNDKCNHCATCMKNCEGAANPHKKDNWLTQECVMCLKCTNKCPEKALSFNFGLKSSKAKPKFDLERRRVISSAAIGVITAPVLKYTFWDKRPNPNLIRPPGALAEPEFLEKCFKCGNCLKVCPTNFLQPTFLEAGLDGIWSPMGIGTKGYCEYNCNMCGQVCPTGAISKISLKKKKIIRIGTAFIDRSRCLPYAFNLPCIVCQEHCPTPKKAIWTEKVTITTRENKKITLLKPHVDLKLCIGCSICSKVCPVVNKPAIYVTNIGESRSKINQLALQS